jgi:BMFP domain-containing protein YqiC
MLNTKDVNNIINQIFESFPPGLKNMPHDLKNNLRAAMQNIFNKLDLVTREEFEAQMGVLLQTRMRLHNLEKKIEYVERHQ